MFKFRDLYLTVQKHGTNLVGRIALACLKRIHINVPAGNKAIDIQDKSQLGLNSILGEIERIRMDLPLEI